MESRLHATPPLARRFSGQDRPDITDVVGRPRTQWRKRAVLLSVYLLAVFSKRYVLPLVPDPWFWGVDFAYFVVLPLLLFWWGWRKPDLVLDDPDAMPAPVADDLNGFVTAVIGVWLFLFLWLLCSCVISLAARLDLADSWLGLLQPTFSYAAHLPQVSLWHWGMLGYLGLTAGLAEEFFFRKAFRQIMQRWTTSRLAFVLASSLVFGLAHWGGGYLNVLTAFAAGLLLAAAYVKLNRLAPLVIGHFLADLVLFS